MVQYRSPYKNFYSDKTGSYMSIGAIVPSLVDSYSTSVGGTITGEGTGGETPAYNYRNFLYCDGEKYDIHLADRELACVPNTSEEGE